ncbi:MAG TPA: hypothetical protein VMT18_16170 [Planctomycetota bacterium]|nr:hypothetical protein [Planctomycetota bacterium]
MAVVTRTIGLSLGADLCWPKCFEDLLADLDLSIPKGRDTLRFAVERVTIEPFDLRQGVKYDVIVDRLTHWYSTSREWIKKAILLDGAYVFNNPWSVQSMEKQTTYCAMIALGLPIPETWLVPPKAYDPKPDLQVTLERYARMFDLGEGGAKVGYPLVMKPYDGGGWAGVSKVDDEAGLREAYEKSDRFVMHLQKGILPYERFCRCIGLGPQTKVVLYDPSAPLHQRYQEAFDFVSPEQQSLLEDITLTINAFFGWDFNSCEALLKDGEWHPIDFANPCPDSQVTSLHFHFPWLVIAKLKWALFCAASKRPFRQNLDWAPFQRVAKKQDLSYREKVARYAGIARERLDAERFEEFCAEHLSHLDELARDYFASDRAREAVRLKVQALFPEHEWEQFTEHFWQSIQRWRAWDAEQSAAGAKR